jgi:hypothetical protein
MANPETDVTDFSARRQKAGQRRPDYRGVSIREKRQWLPGLDSNQRPFD